MKKRLLAVLCVLLVVFMCSCSSNIKTHIVETEGRAINLNIYYVTSKEICAKEVTIPATFSNVISEWLEANELNETYHIVSTRIKTEHNKDIPKSGDLFVYNEIYEFYFSDGFTTFIEKEENYQYYESLLMTLDSADHNFSKMVNDNK